MTDLPTQTKNKHLTFDERLEIQNGLTSGLTFKDIAGRIKKDPSTISKEVKAHLQIHKNGFSSCDGVCPYLLKAPFVCNGCPKKSNAGCRYTRIPYIAKQAQVAYELTLRDSRTGIALNKESFSKQQKLYLPPYATGNTYIMQYKQTTFPCLVPPFTITLKKATIPYLRWIFRESLSSNNEDEKKKNTYQNVLKRGERMKTICFLSNAIRGLRQYKRIPLSEESAGKSYLPYCSPRAVFF